LKAAHVQNANPPQLVSNLKRQLSDYLPLLLIAGAVICLDQASKSLVRSNLALGEVYQPGLWLSQYARLIHAHNSGAAIGIFPSLGNLFMILAILISGAIIYFYPRIPREERLIRLSLALLLGGAAGNLIDRLHQGYVTDFISLLNIPVVNIADLSVSAGVVLLCIGLWRQEVRYKPQPDPAGQEGRPSDGRNLALQALPEATRSE
jgi:signal peptidase II